MKSFRSSAKTSRTTRKSECSIKSHRGTIAAQQIRQVRSKSSCSNTRQNYNKYYIHPELRYRSKAINPKQVSQNYIDQTFVYNNLHNQAFWNWAHPLQFSKLKVVPNPPPNKANISVLQKFRRYIQQKAGKRVPLVINDYLNELIQNQ